MNNIYVLDACAVLALLKGEEGATIVEDIIVQAKSKICNVYMSKYNLLEIYYGFYRSDGEIIAEQRMQMIKNSPISTIDYLSDEVFKEAGRLKAKYKISLADSVALAETKVKNAQIITSDHHEFDIIEKSEDIQFCWIR